MGVVGIIGLVVLAVVLSYGVYRSVTRGRGADRRTDLATDALYKEEGPPTGKPSEKPME